MKNDYPKIKFIQNWHKVCFCQLYDFIGDDMGTLARLELNRYQREFPRIIKSREVSLPKFKKLISKHLQETKESNSENSKIVKGN